MIYICFFFFFKQKTAYEITRRDWSSDVCSSDLSASAPHRVAIARAGYIGPDDCVPALGLARFFQLARQAPWLSPQPLRRLARAQKPEGAAQGAFPGPCGAASGNDGGGTG